MRTTVFVGSAVVAGAALFMATNPAQATPTQLRPCATEDDPGPCHWDARHQGNGRGLSFTVRKGHVRYELPAWIQVRPVPAGMRKELHLKGDCVFLVADTSVIMCKNGRVEVS